MAKKVKVVTKGNLLAYKGYTGAITCDIEDGMLYGKVLGIEDTILYQGVTIEELKRDFMGAVDAYFELCKETGRKPEKPFSGKLLVRVSPELHGQIVTAAQSCGKSMNDWVTEILHNAASPIHCAG